MATIMAHDPYQLLGVQKGASEKDIKSAYRKLAKELHPDYNKDNPAKAEKFSLVTRAYDLLTDKDKRAQFDRGEIDMDGNPAAPFGFGGGGYRSHGQAGTGGADFGGFGNDGIDFGDIFDGLFGGGGSRGSAGAAGRGHSAAKGANTGYKLMVDFISAVTLAPQTVTLSDGKTVSIKLPKGVETGTKIRLAGKGQAGPGGFGDAIVTVTLGKHPHFRKDGDNVLLELPITLKEAVEGGKVRAPTPDGAINLTVKPGMNGGQQLRLKNRGFHTKAGTRGDLIITLRIDIPDNDDALVQFVKDWQPAYDPRSEMQR
jgi:DnaJ-class molecular chaperone